MRYNKRYTITKEHLEKSLARNHATRQPFSEDLLCDLLRPEENLWDKRLLYEVAGVRLEEEDYQDDTSMDDAAWESGDLDEATSQIILDRSQWGQSSRPRVLSETSDDNSSSYSQPINILPKKRTFSSREERDLLPRLGRHRKQFSQNAVLG